MRGFNQGTRFHRHRRLIALTLGVVIVAPLGGYFAWGWLREEASPVSLTEASTRFHHEHSGAAQAAGPLQPAEGVYQYRGHGSDHISVPPMSQSHGPGMPATVTRTTGSCWTFRLDYSSHHWQDWTYCPRGRGLDEQGGHTFQRWDFGVSGVDNLSDFTCTSHTLVAGMKPGDTWQQRCVGHSNAISGTTTSSGPMLFVGIEQLRVGHDRVPAYHLVQNRQVTGGQQGTLHADVWFAPDGLPLRERHSITVATSSPIGNITYDESTDFTLTSLRPQR